MTPSTTTIITPTNPGCLWIMSLSLSFGQSGHVRLFCNSASMVSQIPLASRAVKNTVLISSAICEARRNQKEELVTQSLPIVTSDRNDQNKMLPFQCCSKVNILNSFFVINQQDLDVALASKLLIIN